LLLFIYIIIINLTSYSDCKLFYFYYFIYFYYLFILLTLILSNILRIYSVRQLVGIYLLKCYTLRVCARLRLSIPSHRVVVVTIILSKLLRIRLVRNAIRVCYTLRFALLRFACYLSCPAYICHCCGSETKPAPNSLSPAIVCNHTHIFKPKRQILFSLFQIRPGAGLFENHFRGGIAVSECIWNPLLLYLLHTFLDASIFVIYFFQNVRYYVQNGK